MVINRLEQVLSMVGDEACCPVAVIVKNGKVLLGYRHYTPDKWKKISVWTFSGGRYDHGETLEAALRREVKEETGITDLRIIDYIGEVAGAKSGDRLFLFHCETDQEPRLMEPLKFSEWRWFDVGDYLEGQPDKQINDEARRLVAEYLTAHVQLP